MMFTRVERFTYFRGFIELAGELFDAPWPVRRADLWVDGTPVAKAEITPISGADGVRFQVRALTAIEPHAFRNVSLRLTGEWGQAATLENLGQHEIHSASGHTLFRTFLDGLREAPAGKFLEIGSRARSGVTRRELIPQDWAYTGLDVLAGENVDVVADAHEMSKSFSPGEFHAAMSLSVFEHLAMPWKVAAELGTVLATGGIAYIQSHQTFPLHDEPWDFWRFSKEAWPALFNRHTGFEIIEAADAEAMFVVAQRWHPSVNHGDWLGHALSSVLVRKVGEPRVSWPVPLSETVNQSYPG